jgi:hypothetical protein
LALAVGLVGSTAGVAAVAAASQAAPVAVRGALPANALATGPGASYQAVSCDAGNGCVEVGSYIDSRSIRQPVIAFSVGGVVASGTEVPLPPDKANNPAAELTAVSCPQPRLCLAAGDYVNSLGHRSGFAVTWSNGTIKVLADPPLPASAPAHTVSLLDAVSCAAVTTCLVGGSFADGAAGTQPFIDELSGSAWQAAGVVPLPSTALKSGAQRADVTGLSCFAATACELTGTYSTSGGVLSFVAPAAGGVPAAASALPLGPGAATTKNQEATSAISCPAARSCEAVGDYVSAAGAQVALVVQQHGAGWAVGTLHGPAGLASGGSVALGAVSCAGPGTCEAVGGFDEASGSTGAVIDELVGGAWQPGVGVAPPADVPSAPKLDALGVSCAPSHACTVSGLYGASPGVQLPMTALAYLPPGAPSTLRVTESGLKATISWSAPSVAGSGISSYVISRGLNGAATVVIGTSSTTSFTDGVGLQYHEHYTYAVQAVASDGQTSASAIATLVTNSPASAPRSLVVTPGPLDVTAKWAPPASDGGTPVTGYVMSVTWSGDSEQVTLPAILHVTIPNLVAGRRYTFRIAAVTAGGVGAQSAAVSAVPKP